MTLNEKIAQIVKNLKAGTEQGKIRWDTTIEDGFLTSRPDSSIVIERRRAGSMDEAWSEGAPDWTCRITLRDSIGALVATLQDNELPNPEDLTELFRIVQTTRAEQLADAWLR